MEIWQQTKDFPPSLRSSWKINKIAFALFLFCQYFQSFWKLYWILFAIWARKKFLFSKSTKPKKLPRIQIRLFYARWNSKVCLLNIFCPLHNPHRLKIKRHLSKKKHTVCGCSWHEEQSSLLFHMLPQHFCHNVELEIQTTSPPVLLLSPVVYFILKTHTMNGLVDGKSLHCFRPIKKILSIKRRFDDKTFILLGKHCQIC